jgi:hypothetical protein
LAELAEGLPAIELTAAVSTAAIRRKHRWPGLVRLVADSVFGGEVGGTRFHTLVCDGLLPLLAAQAGGEDRLGGVWSAWPAGDLPANYSRLLRELGLVDKQHRPMSHGVAQGLIGWLLVADRHREGRYPAAEGGGA